MREYIPDDVDGQIVNYEYLVQLLEPTSLTVEQMDFAGVILHKKTLLKFLGKPGTVINVAKLDQLLTPDLQHLFETKLSSRKAYSIDGQVYVVGQLQSGKWVVVYAH